MSLFKQPLLMTCLYTDVQYYKVVSPQFFNTGQATLMSLFFRWKMQSAFKSCLFHQDIQALSSSKLFCLLQIVKYCNHMVGDYQVLTDVKYIQKGFVAMWGHSVDERRNTERNTDCILSLPPLNPGFIAVIHHGVPQSRLRRH